MDKINRKKGSIEIIFICMMLVFFMFIFFSIYLLYSKINLNVYRVKQDLPNILQNAIIAFDKEELAYNNFKINEEKLAQTINTLIDLNYDNVKVDYLNYEKSENRVDIIIEVDLNLDKWNLKDKVMINESVEINMMEISNEF